MTYSLINEFSGSTLFQTRRSLEREDFFSLTEKAYIVMLAMRILLCIPSSRHWAEDFLHRTIQSNHFRQWRSNGTDLYVALYGLTQGQYVETPGDPGPVDEQPFVRWLKALKRDPNDTEETKRLFLKLDRTFLIGDSSLKAIRRLVQNWPNLSHHDHQLVVTRLLQIMRSRTPRAESLRWLTRAARDHNLEMDGVCDRERGGCGGKTDINTIMREPEKKPGTALGFLAGLAGLATGYGVARSLRVKECASAGATASSSIATTSGALGGGFDPNGHKGIYDTGKPKKTKIIRRR